ncbi:MAG: PhoH family protein [Candidatus Berkiella sp.]
MESNQAERKKLFVLDTNILIHDPSALFRFKEHDIYLPMVVLEELDQGKKGLSDTARNIRQVNRYFDNLIKTASGKDIFQGIPLVPPDQLSETFTPPCGKLFFQSEDLPIVLPESLPGNKPDNSILAITLALQAKNPDIWVSLVTKDINLRIKASVLGIHAEDYHNDQMLDDLSFMHSGFYELDENFWENHGKEMSSWKQDGRTFYQVSGPQIKDWVVNTCLYSNDGSDFETIVRNIENEHANIEYSKDFRRPKNKVFGINARNREQNFALNFLMDPEIDFVSLVGGAGTGKTLLTLAAGLAQVIDTKLYREIIMTRVTVPVGEDIGFLPGTEEEKMTPWMGALMDNLEVLAQALTKENEDDTELQEILKKRIRIRSMNFMRGRTFLNKYLIIDEAQNLTSKQMQTMITRAGPGTKIVCLGNVNQIDTPYLTETTSGLTYAVQCFKGWNHSAHMTLTRGERSRLADYAVKVL